VPVLNFTPSSTGPPGATEAVVGTALSAQTLQGHVLVTKPPIDASGKTLPAVSLAPTYTLMEAPGGSP